MTQTNHLVLAVLDCKTRKVKLYEYDPTVVQRIKSKEHIFWDDVPDDELLSQVIENKRSNAS